MEPLDEVDSESEGIAENQNNDLTVETSESIESELKEKAENRNRIDVKTTKPELIESEINTQVDETDKITCNIMYVKCTCK